MALKNILDFEWALNKSLTQEEKDLLKAIFQEIKERNNQRRMEKLNDEFLQRDLEEYVEFLKEEKKLQHELKQQSEELNNCEDENHEKFIQEMIEDIKLDIQWNVSVQTQLLEKIRGR